MADVTVPAPPPLARVNGVELIHTGTWAISTGLWTATTQDLQGAVAALDCPAVRRPGIKIGHEDGRFTDPTQDGDPLLGYVDNLAVTDDGVTLVGDFAGMPAWLAAPAQDDDGSVLSSAYPDRSIEGVHDYVCQIGHTHPFVLTAVALLGVTAPGVGTLQSLQDIAALYGVAAAASDNGVRIRATVRSAPDVVRAAAMAHTGAMVALIPSDADAQRLAVDNGEPAAELHSTLMYLGKAADWDDNARQAVIDAVTQLAAGHAPVKADGFGLSLFNPDTEDACIVLTLGGPTLDTIHEATLAVVTADGVPEQRVPWIPHLTLSYTDDAAVLAGLTDRTGPVVFNRIRVGFAGDHTDIPFTANTQAAAGGRSPMPNPRPTQVAAGVTTEDVRRQYYDDAAWSHWIVEFHINPLQMIVVDDNTGKRFRIPVEVTGEDTFTFGQPVEVLTRYIDAETSEPVAAAAGAQRLVYASRAESRPGKEPKATDPTPVPAPDSVTYTVPDPAGPPVVDDPAPTLTAPPVAPEPPAAEPEPNTEPKEDPVSLSDDMRSRLGLADDADEAAALAALDALITKAETPAEPNPELVTASAEADKERAELRKEVEVLATTVKDVTAKLAASEAEKRAATKQNVIGAAVKAGKIKPADREKWEADYDEAPGPITRVLDSIAAGTAVPVAAVGETTNPEPDGSSISDEALNRLFSTPMPTGKDA